MSDFSNLQLPSGLSRKSALPKRYRPDGYLDGFDAKTLWYDAIWADGTLYVVAPPFNNLSRDIKRARFRVDGRPATLRRMRRYKRHAVLEFSSPDPVQRVSVYLGDWRGESAVSEAEFGRFAGRNTMFYISQNNDLRWMQDHARFHRHHHGAEALIVLDNGSTLYNTAEIEAALSETGLDVLALSAPFKYGPVGLPPYRRLEKYLQTALFNILRLRFLARARAILSVDIDELVLTQGRSVFDLVQQSRLGFLQIQGAWRVPAPGPSGPFLHADHTHVEEGHEACPPKWCLRPDGALGGWSWDVHGIERLPFLHSRTHPDLSFAHCRGVTTGWKKSNRLAAPAQSLEDPAMSEAFLAAGVFSENDESQ
ncbi:MAG: hypothetical protein MK098_11090 [Marinovum sp.]|nr:hypothetical protein [Marinovum sp.]